MGDLTINKKDPYYSDEIANKSEISNIRELKVGTGSTIFFTDKDGSRWGSIDFDAAKAWIKPDGSYKFTNTNGDVLLDSVGVDGNFVNVINTALNTSSKTILEDFTFESTDYAGAFKTGNITWSTTTGLPTGGTGGVFNARGLIFANNGTPTITLDGTTGNATFAGTLAAPSGTLGTITSGTITGATIQTATSGYRVRMTSANGLQLMNGGSQLGLIKADSAASMILQSTGNIYLYSGGSQMAFFTSDSLDFPSNYKITWAGGAEIVGFGDRLFLNYPVEVDGDLYPDDDGIYDIGSIDKRWDTIWGEKYRVEANIEPIDDSVANCGTTDRYWDKCYSDDFYGTYNDYAEMIETLDGEPIETGISVIFEKGERKVRPAKNGEQPIGVISANPTICGGSTEPMWEMNDLNEFILDDKGKRIKRKEGRKNRFRGDKKNWVKVGVMGILPIRKDQPIADNWVFIRKISSNINEYLIK